MSQEEFYVGCKSEEEWNFVKEQINSTLSTTYENVKKNYPNENVAIGHGGWSSEWYFRNDITKMKSIIVRKLWNGYVSIRDYIIEDNIRRGKELVVEYEGKKMILSVDQLIKGKSIHKYKTKF